MESPISVATGRAGRLVDAGLVLLVGGAAFALGCQEMVDSDVWWHVRAGRWIVENGWVPARDPFTFASADRPWIDLHWLFQVMLAAVHGAGGARGMILLAAGLCAAVSVAGLAARDRRWPTWVVAACWLPALVVMSARFAPRPELLSMLAMAGYLAILTRADARPAWLWLLPAVQVVWVNAHSLFVLGPIILGLYLADRLVGCARRPVAKPDRIHFVGAGAAVLLACLASPYGWRGALLPLELFPKITAWGGTYKAYIIEFMDLREFVARQGVPIAAANLYNRAECFLLWALPMSWIVPSAWRAARGDGTGVSHASTMARLAGPVVIALAMGLVLAAAIGLPGQGTPRPMIAMGRMAPVGLAALGAVAAAIVVRSSRRAAMIAAVGGLAASAWMIWLRAYLFGAEPGPSAWLGVPGGGSVPMAWAAGLLGVAAAGLAVFAGGARPFRIALAVAFGYLALQAIRNANLFGLAAGFVLAGNLGEWAAELSAEGPAGSRRTRAQAIAGPAVVAAAAVLLIAATVSGRLFRATGERREFGVSASPTAYAHDAARFAGRPGLPEHALVFSLRQAGVYVFHNGPARKVFMDGRLEVPTRETFETYTLLERLLGDGGRGWREALRRIGDPLVLLDHESHAGAEATLLADPEWRCVYHDPVASIFLSRRRRDLEAAFPTVDFLARHFRDPAWRVVPTSTTSLAEGRALLGLASAMRGRPGVTWGLRASLLLPACDRFRQATDSGRAGAGDWALLGEAIEGLIPDPPSASPSPGADDPWDPARWLLIDQATACYRRALELDPGEIRALFSLYRSFGARGMGDARASIATMMRQAWAAAVGGDADADPGPDRDTTADPEPAEVGPPTGWEQDGSDGLARAIAERIRRRRPETAVRLWNQAEGRGIAAPWAARDRVAMALIDLGRPVEARGVWLGAADPPSPAVRSARLAAAAHATLDFPAARREYRAALEQQPDLGEAWFGLALMHVQLGEADEALAACRAGRKCPLTPPQKAFLIRLERLASGVP